MCVNVCGRRVGHSSLRGLQIFFNMYHSLDACSAAALATAATAAILEEAPSAAEFSSPGRTGPALGG